MSRNNTGNPIGSKAFPDFEDNVKNLDEAVNTADPQWVDRFGRFRLPLMEQERQFLSAQDSRETRFNDFIASSGYQFVGDYAPGIEITEYNQLIRDSNGEFWRVSGQVDLPYVTTGAGVPEDDALVPAGDAVLRQDLANPEKGAGMVGWKQDGAGAVARTMLDKAREFVSVKDFGAVGDGVADDTAAIQAADDLASSSGKELKFESGKTYLASELFIKSKMIDGQGAKLVKSATTNQGFFNWGRKPEGMEGGLLRNITIDAGLAENVLNLRIYGNHLNPRISGVTLLNSDFYAFGVGALQTPGDKLDQVDGLQVDGLYIESERGNTVLGTTYSFGIEAFPWVVCNNWVFQNVYTKGKIINKFHMVKGLHFDCVRFIATSVFNPLSSGYCEINNCAQVTVSENCVFDALGATNRYALQIGGTRVVDGLELEVTGVVFNATVNGVVAINKVLDIDFCSSAKISRLWFRGDTGRISIKGATIGGVIAETGESGSLDTLEITNATITDLLRINNPNIPVANLYVSGGILYCTANSSRFEAVENVLIQSATIILSGTAQSYAIWTKGRGTSVTLANVLMRGDGVWDRPLYVTDGGKLRVINSVFESLASSILHTTGSEALEVSVGNIVNGVLA